MSIIAQETLLLNVLNLVLTSRILGGQIRNGLTEHLGF
jgi:hypothetical protein